MDHGLEFCRFKRRSRTEDGRKTDERKAEDG